MAFVGAQASACRGVWAKLSFVNRRSQAELGNEVQEVIVAVHGSCPLALLRGGQVPFSAANSLGKLAIIEPKKVPDPTPVNGYKLSWPMLPASEWTLAASTTAELPAKLSYADRRSQQSLGTRCKGG